MRLDGCRPVPLGSYLKGLGALRIVAESADPNAAAWWSKERMEMDTVLGRDGVLDCIASYEPTPAISPWSLNMYRSGVEMLRPVLHCSRFAKFAEAIKKVDAVLAKFAHAVDKKSVDKSDILQNKEIFLTLCRNMLPDGTVRWLDAVVVLGDKAEYAPIGWSGGNDAHFDMAVNFAKNLALVHGDVRSAEWLDAAIFGGNVKLVNESTSGHDPRYAGAPNTGAGYRIVKMVNPWNYILMMEGLMMLGGAVGRRYSAHGPRLALFPFTATHTAAGYASAGGEESLGEIWMPLWERPATYREVLRMFGLARMDVGGRRGETGVDFGRAVRSFAAGQHINAFHRHIMLKRKGEMYVTIGAGRVESAKSDAARILDDLDDWRTAAARDKDVGRQRRTDLERVLDRALLQMVTHGGPERLQDVLVAAAELDAYLLIIDVGKPLMLGSRWIAGAYDGTPEFRLAAAVASIGCSGPYHIRDNVKPAGKDTSRRNRHVWNARAEVVKNMENVVMRRAVDAGSACSKTMPVWSSIRARRDDVAAFLDGRIDDRKLERLVRGLVVVSSQESPWDGETFHAVDLPEAYCILRKAQAAEGRLDVQMLSALKAGNVDGAYSRAVRMLLRHDLRPKRTLSRRLPNSTTVSNVAKKRLLASMLFNVSGDFDGALARVHV